jgi:hypothetical protein
MEMDLIECNLLPKPFVVMNGLNKRANFVEVFHAWPRLKTARGVESVGRYQLEKFRDPLGTDSSSQPPHGFWLKLLMQVGEPAWV